MLVHVLFTFMLVLALVLVLVRVDAGTGRLKGCYSNAQPSRLPLQLCRGNDKAHSCTVYFYAGTGTGTGTGTC